MKMLLGILAVFVLLSANAAQAHDPSCNGSGCKYSTGGLRLGDEVYATTGSRDGSIATIVAIQPNGKMVLRFSYDGRTGPNWTIEDVAAAEGCASTGLCVGQEVYATTGSRSGSLATIVGVSRNGTYVIRFSYDGRVGSGWTINDIACAN